MVNFYSYSYSIPYCCLALGTLCMATIKTRFNHKLTERIFLFVIICFIGLRGFVNTDYLQYYQTFENLEPINRLFYNYDWKNNYEFGFYIYTSIIKTIFPNYHFFVIINTIVDVAVLTWFFHRYSKLFYISWLFFFLFNGLQIEFDLFRNAKAIMIFLLAIPYIQSRNVWKFTGMILLASTFHISAIVLYPMYFIGVTKLKKTVLVGLFIFVNIIFFMELFPTSFLIEKFSGIAVGKAADKLDTYINTTTGTYGVTFGYIEKSAMYLICYYFYDKLIRDNKSNLIFCNGFFIYYTLWYIFSDVSVFVQRIPVLYVFSYWVVSANIISLLKKKTRQYVYIFLALFSILKIGTSFNTAVNKYDNLLTGIESYEKRARKLRGFLKRYY